jgi:hypothetical protein
VYLDCVTNPSQDLILSANALHEKHNKFGNVLEKSVSGEVINVYNINAKQ